MALTQRYRRLAPLAFIGATGLLLAGCTGRGNGGGGVGGGHADCPAYVQYGSHEGGAVEVYTTSQGVELDQMAETFFDFEDCTGITVDLVGTQEAETQINVRAA